MTRRRQADEAAALRDLEAVELELETLERRQAMRGAFPPEWAAVEREHPCRPPREKVTLRVDRDVLAWFRKRGLGYQAQINAVLRAYVVMRKGGLLAEREAEVEAKGRSDAALARETLEALRRIRGREAT